jgi:hypothetical protein
MNMMDATRRERIRSAYQGEIIGERLYRKLAAECANEYCKIRFQMIADVEAITREKLQAVADRHAIEASESEIQNSVTRRAAELKKLSWAEFIELALAQWPTYVGEFDLLARAAEAADRDALQFLVAHETALVEFARLEQQADVSRSLVPLQALLAAGRAS